MSHNRSDISFDSALVQILESRATQSLALYVWGPMGSGKSSAALHLKSTLASRGATCVLAVAGTKRRAEVRSRDGLSAAAIPIADLTGRFDVKNVTPDFLLVDEAQFLDLHQIDVLVGEIGGARTQILMFGLYFEATGQPFLVAKQLKSMGVPMILAPKRLACRCGRLAVADRRSLNTAGDIRYESVCLRHLRDAR